QHPYHALSQVVFALAPLVGVGIGTHGDVVAGPAPGGQLGPEPLHSVDLDDNPSLEVLAHVEAQILVGRAGKTVRTGVTAPAVDVDGVAEGHLRRRRHLVDDR